MNQTRDTVGGDCDACEMGKQHMPSRYHGLDCPRRKQRGSKTIQLPDLEAENTKLKAEITRLQFAEAEAMALVVNHEGAIERLTKERDELQRRLAQEERNSKDAYAANLVLSKQLDEANFILEGLRK